MCFSGTNPLQEEITITQIPTQLDLELGFLHLLVLIGYAVTKSKESVELFEQANSKAGCRCLIAVIAEIDKYLNKTSEDPLLQLVPIDHADLNTRLQGVKEKLREVVKFFQPALLDHRT
ncbi:hypothetical protein LM597_01820 [Candidatus Acetothermia bacterium]|nr:hypothetical protein [Candidatus Acetothermia bacterium]